MVSCSDFVGKKKGAVSPTFLVPTNGGSVANELLVAMLVDDLEGRIPVKRLDEPAPNPLLAAFEQRGLGEHDAGDEE